jgi:hypothetical protein
MYGGQQVYENQVISKKANKIDDEEHGKKGKKNKKNKQQQTVEVD